MLKSLLFLLLSFSAVNLFSQTQYPPPYGSVPGMPIAPSAQAVYPASAPIAVPAAPLGQPAGYSVGSGDPLYDRAKQADAAVKIRPDRIYGTLDVTTSTPEAEFWLGIYYVDKTPLSNFKLPVGTYNYRVRLSRFDDVTGTLTIKPNEKTLLTLPLSRSKGSAVIKTNIDSVRVSLNDHLFGIADTAGLKLSTMDAGLYIFKLEKNGYLPQERTLQIIDGEITGLNSIMLQNFGSVRVEWPEQVGFVYINNIYYGRSPITVGFIRPGKAIVKVEQEGFAPLTKTIFVKPDETTQVTVALKKDRSYTNMSPYGKLKGSWGDRDGDGIPNDIDKCPDDPEDIDGFEDQDGCPDPDNDHDGIPDIKDKCPNLAEDYDHFQDADGCPEPDNDSDMVADSVDLCPNVQEDKDGYQDMDGCPDYDNDQDGVKDSVDVCVNQPEDKDGFQDTDGCPDVDNDQDGVKDFMDDCPTESETYNNYQDDDGCPDARVAEPRSGTIAQLKYDPKAPTLPLEVFDQIDSVYKAMVAYPKMEIQIKVHSDSRGKPSNKMQQTVDRANLIQRYIGYRALVSPARIQVLAMGGKDPISSNVSEEGRGKNNRVEIKRVK